ncbi:hypothetical protein EDC01DRAFT_634574 [Geopyxis carbonaria]|nr:hypothetical protein EDC01DRAFT_634574 [Geopyxis carbonaria]
MVEERAALDRKRERLLAGAMELAQREMGVTAAERRLEDDRDALRVQTRQNALWLAREIEKVRVLNDKVADLLILPVEEATPCLPIDIDALADILEVFDIEPLKADELMELEPVAHCDDIAAGPSSTPATSLCLSSSPATPSPSGPVAVPVPTDPAVTPAVSMPEVTLATPTAVCTRRSAAVRSSRLPVITNRGAWRGGRSASTFFNLPLVDAAVVADMERLHFRCLQ